MNDLGLSAKQLKIIIQSYLDKNADLIIGVDDPELVQLIDVLGEAMAVAIVKNNQKIQEQFESATRRGRL